MSEKLLLKAYTINSQMPKNYVEGELDFCRREFTYQTFDVELIEVDDCLVNDQGFIYTSYFNVHKKSLLNPDYYSGYFNLKHYLKKVIFRNKKETDPDKKYLLAFNEWGHAHYHWFCDTLPRIYSVKESLKDYYLLLPDHSSYIKEIGLKSLELLGLHPKGIEFIKSNELLQVKHLSLVTLSCLPGYINDHLISRISEDILRRSGNNSLKPKRKLYIIRGNVRYRKVLNEDQVLDVMKHFGYEIINYENMSLEEQISVTASARCMVSIHGAGLTNMIYMQPGSNVLEFRRDRIYHNQCYWHLADAVHLNYHYLFGTPDDDLLVIESEGCNLTIDIGKLVAVLNQME
ncbi:hypothetical protein ADIARSV_2815 [Arcticibacter svalbardensis MN12-7]|uniref:Glycosyltransferase 61 catalytic domain-containing protein n=2 Tax=Arcticibacter TaxID=1288026 RepID=R9GQH9_9SPHI|nr:hypothetical protein ADIARSV_2815 [Arcticibacter svalbardensis MN12-7]